MAYESYVPFSAIRDFRDAEINGIPALFTMTRPDPETLPAEISLVRGYGRPGQRFSVARAAGYCNLHRNICIPAAPALEKTLLYHRCLN